MFTNMILMKNNVGNNTDNNIIQSSSRLEVANVSSIYDSVSKLNSAIIQG